ncbi:MAG: GIY-YIG nuclease family protein [Pirellulales bacterium]
MAYAFFAILGIAAGAICTFVALDAMRRSNDDTRRKNAQIEAQIKASNDALDQRIKQVNAQLAEEKQSQEARIQESLGALNAREIEMSQRASTLATERASFDSQVVKYKDLQDENSLLRRDLRNLDISLRKITLDREQQRERQETLDQRANDLSSRYLKENIKWIGVALNQNNFANCKKRLQDAIERCRGIGFEVSESEESSYFANLRRDYEIVVRAAFEREEQARIRAQIREEQQLAKEVEREIQQLERERQAIEAALAKAIADAKDQHSEEVEKLKVRLAEAEAKSQRAISQAQLTKSGYVYVISNLGSFGDGVFKVGLTRRLEPLDRVHELGGASVPFPFDVHMMISCDNAPALEHALHKALHKHRVNKTNPRKEYFKTTIGYISEIVRQNHGEVEFIADAEALQYRQSLEMSEEDQEFIERVYNDLEKADVNGDED